MDFIYWNGDRSINAYINILAYILGTNKMKKKKSKLKDKEQLEKGATLAN